MYATHPANTMVFYPRIMRTKKLSDEMGKAERLARKIRHWALNVKSAISARHPGRGVIWTGGAGRIETGL